MGEKNSLFRVPYKYEARDYQKPFWEAMASGKKRACLTWHRRSGKDLTVWNYMICMAVLKPGNYFYLFPSYSQGRKVIWDGKDREGNTFLSYIHPDLIIGTPNSTMMQIKLRCKRDKNSNEDGKKYSMIQILGSDNYDSIMGTSMQGAVFSEYSIQDPSAWQYMMPILLETGGWAIFVQTPRGHNHGKSLYDMSSQNPSWFCEKLSVEDTIHEGKRVISDEVIEEERKAGTSEDLIQQEFYVSFNMGIDGSFYGWYLEQAEKEERITIVPWKSHMPVYIAMDLGYSDYTSICFFQICQKEIHVIDYFEDQNRDFSYYVKKIKEKPYNYKQYFAPHDAANKSLSTGLSVQEVSGSLGIPLTILPTQQLGLYDGIECVRSAFGSIWIDKTNCAKLVKSLQNYQKIRDPKNHVYRDKPAHTWASHGADAFRYMCISAKLYGNSSGSINDEEYKKMRNKYIPSFT